MYEVTDITYMILAVSDATYDNITYDDSDLACAPWKMYNIHLPIFQICICILYNVYFSPRIVLTMKSKVLPMILAVSDVTFDDITYDVSDVWLVRLERGEDEHKLKESKALLYYAYFNDMSLWKIL